jgi:1-acyl-sn-glycerol-3-phosphate acyltransferase
MFRNFLEKFYRSGAKVIVRILYRVNLIGFSEHFPKEGPCIVISNHVSYMDGMILNYACPRKVRFVIDEEIYKTPGVHHFMSIDRAIPILPTKDSVKKALQKISDGLKAGDIICIFPEGQITYTGHMIRFKLGIEWIVKNDPVPIVPVALIGLWGSIFSRKYRKEKWRFIPRFFRKKLTVVCGNPIPPSKATINHLQREVMRLKSSFHHQ